MSISPTRLYRRIRYAARATRAIAADPYEGLERTLERAFALGDRHPEARPYAISDQVEQRAHELMGAPWPCEAEGFQEVWDSALADLRAQSLDVGRSAYGGWDDGDVRLGRLAWCLTRHLRPARVAETGVARGLTTRVVLEALARNGTGSLWSIDLPPLLEQHLAGETAAAVPPRLRGDWTLLRGSSRRRLPELVQTLGKIDLFIHDSMHTTRNVAFELNVVWPVLAPGGAVLIDDVEQNDGTARFLAARPDTPSLIGCAADGSALIGLLVKPPAHEPASSSPHRERPAHCSTPSTPR